MMDPFAQLLITESNLQQLREDNGQDFLKKQKKRRKHKSIDFEGEKGVKFAAEDESSVDGKE